MLPHAEGSAVAVRAPWLDGRLVASPTTRRLRIGGRTVLFCERAQQLFELNPTADLIWRSLAEGRTPAETAEELTAGGATAADALRFVTTCAAEWIAEGRLTPEATVARARQTPSHELRLHVGGLGCALALHVGPDDPLPAEVRAAFGQFEASVPPDALRLTVVETAGVYALLRDGEPHGVFTPERIAPELKAVLTEAMSKAVAGGDFLLHAALLTQGGRALLITGPPGAGKTTLTVALAARGLGYGGDDIVRVFGDGRLEGVPFSPAAKAGAWSLLASYAPVLAETPVRRRGDGQEVRYLPTVTFAPARAQGLGGVLLLDRRSEAAPSLEPVNPLEALTALLASAYAGDRRLEAGALERFARAVDGAACRRLVYSDLAEAVETVLAFLDR